jgi:hypothetical protein
MARRTVSELKSVQRYLDEAVAEFQDLSEIRYELAKRAYKAQSATMQNTVDSILATLRIHAKDYIDVQLQPPHGALVPVKIERRYVDFNLLYIAMDILKNLALFDIRIGDYEFPPSLCTNCEAVITQREARVR